MLRICGVVPFLLIVPPVLSAFLDWSNDELPASIQSLYVAGDKSTPTLADKALRRNQQIRYVNGYGPSEAAVNTHHFMLYHQDLAALNADSIPIGQLMLNTTAFVLNKVTNQPVCHYARLSWHILSLTLAHCTPLTPDGSLLSQLKHWLV